MMIADELKFRLKGSYGSSRQLSRGQLLHSHLDSTRKPPQRMIMFSILRQSTVSAAGSVL